MKHIQAQLLTSRKKASSRGIFIEDHTGIVHCQLRLIELKVHLVGLPTIWTFKAIGHTKFNVKMTLRQQLSVAIFIPHFVIYCFSFFVSI